jgi:hypothetical protein
MEVKKKAYIVFLSLYALWFLIFFIILLMISTKSVESSSGVIKFGLFLKISPILLTGIFLLIVCSLISYDKKISYVFYSFILLLIYLLFILYDWY